jgi:hypothetical protein
VVSARGYRTLWPNGGAFVVSIGPGESRGDLSFADGKAPEIDISARGVAVPSGSTMPSSSNSTDFLSVAAKTGSSSRTFAIRNLGNAPLLMSGKGIIQLAGANRADFRVVSKPPTTIAAGESATFKIVFDPSRLGLRTATVVIANNDFDENPYTFDIQGTGTRINAQASVAAAPATMQRVPIAAAMPLFSKAQLIMAQVLADDAPDDVITGSPQLL